MDHKYANSNSIFRIHIHELAYNPIFKAFADFLAELLTMTNCTNCVTYGTSGRDTYRYVKMTATLLEIFHDMHTSICVSAT